MKKVFLVEAGNHDRHYCPVRAELEVQGEFSVESFRELPSGKPVEAQIEKNEGGKIAIWWIIDSLKAGSNREYEIAIKEGSGQTPNQGVRLQFVGDKKIDVFIGNDIFTSYIFRDVVRPHLYPLIGPYGLCVTRRLATKQDKDLDHHHHRSFWVAHGDINGVDNWSEQEGHGYTAHRSFEIAEGGPVYAHIRAISDWTSNSGEKVLEELRDLRIYNLPEHSRIIDMTVVFTALEENVNFGDTKEGGIASLRVETSMEVRNGGKIENSYGGINEAETWGKRAHWCDYSGPIEGRIVGVSLFDHPENFRYPTYWHVRDYGLMTANPFGLSYFKNDPNIRGDYKLKAHESLKFSYRLYIHPGDASEGRVAERYNDFINPPKVEVS